MPIHDWTLVDAGTFHDLHQAWITHLKETLNGGLLPDGYYAMGEQIASGREPDVLALRVPSAPSKTPSGGVAVAETAPAARHRLRPTPLTMYHRKTRSVVIRHASGHEVVAIIEIVARANKDREQHVAEITGKIVKFPGAGVHVLLLDLLPPGKHDPAGIHGRVWANYDDEPYLVTADEPLTMASYECSPTLPEAYVEPTAVGRTLIDMPVFLREGYYVDVPLEATYMAAYRGMPRIWKDVLEGERPA